MVSAKHIGLAVKEFRRARKMTQAELGEAVERTADAISQIERGINVPNVETLLAISTALSVSVDGLLLSEDDVPVSAVREGQIRKAYAVLQSLKDEDLDIALDQLRALAKHRR